MSNPASTLSTQIGRLSFGLAVVTMAIVGGLAWWAATRIDDDAVHRQTRAIHIGLQEAADRLPIEQDSSSIWDDAVVNLRSRNDVWLAENIAEWMSEYYGHDWVYLLDPRNAVVRAVAGGKQVPDDAYDRDRAAIEPLVLELRGEMAAASVGQADSRETVTGLGTIDKVILGDGSVGIVSVRPIVPGSAAVAQAPGTEFLHVSVLLIGGKVTDAIATKFGIEKLQFGAMHEDDGAAMASAPVLNRAGRIVGFFSWQPYRPALQLLRETGPALAAAALAAVLVLTLLLRRLKRTSARLEISEGKATFLAFHDPLTGIPNRALFADRLSRAIANRRRSGANMALHAIDLDRFKPVNDMLGHHAGDELLRQAAVRLVSLISEIDTVARLGGDEFAIIQVDVHDAEEVLKLSQRIIIELQRPFDLAGHEATIGASVGVVYSDDTSSEAEDLLRQADIALYEAKTSGRGRYQLFAGELDVAIRERRSLELELRGALSGEPGLELVYQPIYHATSGEIVGAEALVRWNNPKRGRLSPIEFIGLAEERGLIDQLGLWVLREACKFAVTSSVPWVAVNVSPVQFRDDRFAGRVLAVLAEVGLPANRLEIEITEGLLLQNSPGVRSMLMQLRAAGIRVALDDFGTGYSSISYLLTHGVDKLKIDQSFVAKVGKDLEIENIVSCIIGLASAMHMKVTAEGVETAEQQAMLQKMGCGQLQGYMLSRPVTPARLRDLLESSKPQQGLLSA